MGRNWKGTRVRVGDVLLEEVEGGSLKRCRVDEVTEEGFFVVPLKPARRFVGADEAGRFYLGLGADGDANQEIGVPGIDPSPQSGVKPPHSKGRIRMQA